MLLTGRSLLRQLSLKLLRKWLKLKLQKRPRKKLFLKNKKKTRRSMMKLSLLKLLHSRLLKNKQKKHKRQLLQLEKHCRRKISQRIRQKWRLVRKNLMKNTEMCGLPDQQEFHISNSQSTTGKMLMLYYLSFSQKLWWPTLKP